MSGYPFTQAERDALDPNLYGTREARQSVKRKQLEITPRPLTICFTCGVVFPDRANTYAEPYWYLDCPEHRV